MADRALSWQPQRPARDPVGAAATLRRSRRPRGFSRTLHRGAALEQPLRRARLARGRRGETRHLPPHPSPTTSTAAALEYARQRGRRPELTLGELARIAVARPLRGDAVRVEGELYADGGVIDAFPARAARGRGRARPRRSGRTWRCHAASSGDGQIGLAAAQRTELARRTPRAARDAAHPGRSRWLPASYPAGLGLYDLFLDRRRWPELIRRGYEAAARRARAAAARTGPGAA